MTQQRAFAASAASHDDEDIAVADSEVDVAHQHETAIRHREVFHDDMRLVVLSPARSACAGGHRRLSRLDTDYIEHDGE